MRKIKTTGQIRGLLIDTLQDIKDNKYTFEQAMLINKTSSEITKSLYLEAKMQAMAISSGNKASQFGHLIVDESVDK